MSSGIGNRRKKRSFLLRKCDVIKITQCWTIGNNGHHNVNLNSGINNWSNGNNGNVDGHNGYSGNNRNNKWNNNGSNGGNNNQNVSSRNENGNNKYRYIRNNGIKRNSGNMNNRNNRNEFKGNGNGGINENTRLNKWKQFIGYRKIETGEGENRDRNQQSDCKECNNVRKKRHMSRRRVKRYNSREDYEVTYDLSELPFGSFCGDNTATGNLQQNSNNNGNGNKNINNGHGNHGNSNGSGRAERCKIINKVKCPSN